MDKMNLQSIDYIFKIIFKIMLHLGKEMVYKYWLKFG